MKMSDDLLEELTLIRVRTNQALGNGSAIYIKLADFHSGLCKHFDQHDQLVAINKELVDALERVVKWDELSVKTRCDIGSNGQRDYYRNIAQAALNFAAAHNPKELTK